MPDLVRLDALRRRFVDQPTRAGVPYAEALRRAGRLEDAIAVLRTALGEAPRNVLGLGILARCLRDLGDSEEAGIAVRSALALDPDDPVLSELADLVTFAPTRPEEASSDVIMAVEETPVIRFAETPLTPEPIAEPGPSAPPTPMASVFVTQTMAELHVQQGLPARAVAIYRELLLRAPDDVRLATRLTEVVALAQQQEAAGPASLSDAFAVPSAFDFSDDAHRVAPMISATEESMLASLSFEAIVLPTPAPDGAGLDLPVGAGPTAREALRHLVQRPVVRTAAWTAGTGAAPSSRAGSPPPADLTGDDFDQWLREIS